MFFHIKTNIYTLHKFSETTNAIKKHNKAHKHRKMFQIQPE